MPCYLLILISSPSLSRSFSILEDLQLSTAPEKKRNRVNKQKEIEEKMNTIRNNEYETNNDELILLQNELELIRKEHMKGLMVRARAKWIEEGEKPTKYFLALEKRNYINKTISKIANDSGVLITNQQEILNEIKYFYQTLYSNKDNDLNDVDIEEIIDKSLVNILDSNMREKLEGKITYSEALEALKNMKNDKSPGSDGFTAEFLNFSGKIYATSG